MVDMKYDILYICQVFKGLYMIVLVVLLKYFLGSTRLP